MWKYTNTTPDLEGGVVTRGGNAGNRLVTLYYPKDHLICTCGARVGASTSINTVRPSYSYSLHYSVRPYGQLWKHKHFEVNAKNKRMLRYCTVCVGLLPP